MVKVFLGGTCNGSTWRDDLISMLECDYFNPVVENWTPECQAVERVQREACDYCLYVLTPEMTGTYAIAEVVDDSNKRPEKTVLCVINHYGNQPFTAAQIKSFEAVEALVEANGATVCRNLPSVATFLNSKV